MLITLFTDASFSERLCRGTWAVWFKADGVTYRFSGKIKGTLTQSGDGELSAVANGLHLIVRSLTPPEGSRIIAQTDSQEAISAIQSWGHPRDGANAILLYIRTLLTTHRLRLELRHVKGHKGTITPRNAVNTWCDKECRRQMGELLAASGVLPPVSAAILPFPQPNRRPET